MKKLHEQPPGFSQDDSSLVYHLKKSLYGIEKFPQDWYEKIENFLLVVSLGINLIPISTLKL
jgi:hypothetical protein